MWKISDNLKNTYTATKCENAYVLEARKIAKDVEYIDFVAEAFEAQAGSEGYYVIADFKNKGARLCFFRDRDDCKQDIRQRLLPIFGVKTADKCTLIIVEGFKHAFSLVYGVKDGRYYIYPRFYLENQCVYEDIRLRVVELEQTATYSDMAVAYRNYQLDRDACALLSEKAKSRKELAYAIQAPEIRIRMGWKPAPPTVLEQTRENEPEMKVACTFDRVCDLVDELKAQGVDKAQICLVGWNKSGHDGRWPEMFPVEEKLGGEERLRHLISYAQENGYQITCHTNSTDCYSIADTFSEDIVMKKADGTLQSSTPWSGGRMYNLCPVKALEYAKADLPKVKDLGFAGLHYIDVMSLVRPRRCYDVRHPLNPGQTEKIYAEIMNECHTLFGGFSSEGCLDYAVKYLDYGLYIAFPAVEDVLSDKVVPLWQIVYHGIVLYNSSPSTINYTIKKPENRLMVLEDGARPSFYVYSKFLEGSETANWMGNDDLIMDTDEQLKYSVSKIKEAYDEYKHTKHLQTECIANHREIDDNVFEITYTNGETITVDYNAGTVTMR